MSFRRLTAIFLIAVFSSIVFAQSKSKPSDKFRQLEEILPTPNEQRTASGAPGNKYWQQRADYQIDVELDDVNQRINGKETVTYKNFSPDSLNYIWLQIDQNIYAKDSDSQLTRPAPEFKDSVPLGQIEQLVARNYDGRISISNVRDAKNTPLKSTVVKTMMRIDLPAPLAPGGTFVFSLDWNYTINDGAIFGGRTSYERFADGNYIYTIAQWFPRMAAYNDVTGWQHKQYLGSGEFTLEFGDYLVRLTVPNDHVVTATGVLQNSKDVLKPEWIARLKQAETAKEPLKIVTNDEAKANEKGKPSGKKTWIFKADNVRDFAFASSRKFIWDAQGHNVGGNKVTAQSFYPNEASPLWDKFSTQAIIHTLNVYSRYSFDYPYPIATSVNNRYVGGMEYPMICFNGPRPNSDGTYTAQQKYGLISVVIHEVGHNYFPMTVNSDERQWTWMDEGLNSFLEYLAEQEWEKDYPSRRGEPKNIADYMASENQVPIMTNSESVLQFGNNAYGKPATALNILRETVLGRENFDFAFKTYAQRWKFKRPMPADFFRTMEDASGTDLDWFWRGWFYTTDSVDISIENVRLYQINSGNPDTEKGILRQQSDAQPKTLSQQRNEALPKRVDEFPSLKDLYNDVDKFKVSDEDKQTFQTYLNSLSDGDKAIVNGNNYFYVIDLKNVGGLVMPLIFKMEYVDGTSEEIRIPAEIWRYNNFDVSKLIITKKEAKSIVLDPNLETADTDLSNNYFPRRALPTRFQVFKNAQGQRRGTPRAPLAETAVGSVNLTGKWAIAIDAGGQTVALTLNLTQTGNVITGTIESAQGVLPITSGSFQDGKLILKTTAPVALTFDGQVVGAAMSGNVEAPQGTTTFSGSKVQ